MASTLHFKNKVGYRKFLAYGHIHTKKGLLVTEKKGRISVFAGTHGNQKIFIGGRPHKVSHRRN